MQTVRVEITEGSKADSYNVYIGKGILDSFFVLCDPDKYSSFIILADLNVKECPWFQSFLGIIKLKTIEEPKVIYLPAGEKGKNIQVASEIWEKFHLNGLDRKSLAISLGGGAVCDLTGFASSTYMRGLDFIHIPTTLLSQVDASIGGKTGINFNEVKNLIGTFNQPKAVVIDINTLTTLPERELNAGYAEVIKHGLIQDEKFYKKIKSAPASKKEEKFLEDVIYCSSMIKAAVVGEDSGEAGLRKILNFGHTFGHAIESLSHKAGKPYLHGEAVSIGMVAEAKLSEFLGYLSHKQVLDIEETLKSYGLPTRLEFKASFEDTISKISSDKKNTGSKVNWSLLKKIGKASYDEIASQEQVREALQYISHAT